MALLVARIGAPKDPYMHQFQKWPLRASVFKSLKTNMWIRTLGFTTGVLQQRMAQTEWLVYGSCKPPVVRIWTEVSDVRIHMLVFSDLKTSARMGHFWNGCTQGSFGTPMRATRMAILTDACNGLLGNGCAQGIGQILDACNLHPGVAGNPSNRGSHWCLEQARVRAKMKPSFGSQNFQEWIWSRRWGSQHSRSVHDFGTCKKHAPSAVANTDEFCGQTRFLNQNSPLRSRILLASLKIMRRPRSDHHLHFDIGNK